MTESFYAGTRKGLFRFEKAGTTWRQSGVWFLGDPVPMFLHDQRDDALYVTVEHGHFGTKLHRSVDLGETWEELDTPRYPEKPDAEPDTLCPMRGIVIPWSLEKIWSLETGGAAQPGMLWCGTIPGGLFQSTDRGESWTLNRPLWDRPERARWCGGGYDYPGIHSVAVNPQEPDDIMLGVSCGGAWRTRDGGASWSQSAHGMFFNFNPEQPNDDPEGQDPHRLVRCPAAPEQMWVQHHCGIFRLTDDARKWDVIPEVSPSGFGFAVAVHPRDPSCAWFVPAVKDDARYPVDGRLVVTRTRDGGASFDQLVSGLPQENCYDLIYRHGLDVDTTGQRLVMASTTGSLWISENEGDDWVQLSSHLPPVYCVRFA